MGSESQEKEPCKPVRATGMSGLFMKTSPVVQKMDQPGKNIQPFMYRERETVHHETIVQWEGLLNDSSIGRKKGPSDFSERPLCC